MKTRISRGTFDHHRNLPFKNRRSDPPNGGRARRPSNFTLKTTFRDDDGKRSAGSFAAGRVTHTLVLVSARIFPLSSSTNVSRTFTFISIMVNTCVITHSPSAWSLGPSLLTFGARTAPPPPADRRSRLTSFTTASFIFAIVSVLPTAR